MTKDKLKSLNGTTVRFEIIDDDDNVVEVIAEKTFPNAVFSFHMDSWSGFYWYHCWDSDVCDYVYKQHCKNNSKYHFSDWENSPNIRQAFYNGGGDLMYTEDEVDYEMNL